MSNTLQQAITLIQSGDRQNGKSLLADVIKADPQNERAWLWLTIVMDSSKQRQECLQRVLVINPHNQSALEGLAFLQEEQFQRRESFGALAGPLGGLLSGIISTIGIYYLSSLYLGSVFHCDTCGGLAIAIPVFLIVIVLSGYFIGSFVYKWLCYPNPPKMVEAYTLQQAISLIQAGYRQNGKLLLTDILKRDPQNEQAWLWMSVVEDDYDKRRRFLKRVLQLNPHNQQAIEGLAILQQRSTPLFYKKPHFVRSLINVIAMAFSGLLILYFFWLFLTSQVGEVLLLSYSFFIIFVVPFVWFFIWGAWRLFSSKK